MSLSARPKCVNEGIRDMSASVELPVQTEARGRPSRHRKQTIGWIWERHVWPIGFFLLYFTFSLLRHHELLTGGFDLGIFDQAVRSYAGFHGPIADIKGVGFNLFGDHVHPIIALLVPFYWLH